MCGWIKLHRSWLNSDTIQLLNAEQQAITLQILLRVNHKDGKWFDANRSLEVEVKRGQVITSRNKIANEWFGKDKSITEQKIRTTLKKLEKLGFLTIESTKTYTVLNVVNYGVYQDDVDEVNQDINQEVTKSQPSVNQEATTNKNDIRMLKNDKEINTSRRKSKIYDKDSVYYRLANRLLERIKQNNAAFKDPNLNKWADDIRLMMEIDKRTEKQIEYLIDWCQGDSFWKANILSPAKLRKQFDHLVIKVTSKSKSQKDENQQKLITTERPAHLAVPVVSEDTEKQIEEALEELPY